MMKISSYIHPYKKDENFALWHSLQMKKLYGSKVLEKTYNDLASHKEFDKDELSKYPSLIVSLLLDNRFIVALEDDEMQSLVSAQKESEGIKIKNLVLLISNACNFNCEYCQIEKNIEQGKQINMTEEIAESAINLFLENQDNDAIKTVTITGGEPFLNPEILKFIIEKADQEIANKRIVLFTNGSLVTQPFIDLFKKHDVLVLLSMDGPKEMHDHARKTAQGDGTFEKVFHSYKQLSKAGVNVGISAVGGPHNIHELEKLINFFLDLHPASIGLNFSHLLINQENPMEIPISEFGKALVEFYKEMRKKNIFVENISRIISAFSKEAPRLHECQAEGTGFTVDARGKLGPCKSLLVSDVFSFDMDDLAEISNNELFLRWNQRTPVKHEFCQNCPSVMLCGGGCAYDSYIQYNGEFEQPDRRVCGYQNYVLEFLIWDLFDSIKEKLSGRDIYMPSSAEISETFTQYYVTKNKLQQSVGHDN